VELNRAVVLGEMGELQKVSTHPFYKEYRFITEGAIYYSAVLGDLYKH
jgi:hypothetical protein